MAFGLHVEGYSTIATSLLSLFQLVMGIFDYDELYRANRVLAPLLFVVFTVLVVFVLMNIFLAIINDAFMLVNEHQRASQKDVGTRQARLEPSAHRPPRPARFSPRHCPRRHFLSQRYGHCAHAAPMVHLTCTHASPAPHHGFAWQA